MAAIPVLVTLEEGANVEAVREAIRGRGFGETSFMSTLGILYGTVESAALATLQSVPGVKAVEHERQVQLPPLDRPS